MTAVVETPTTRSRSRKSEPAPVSAFGVSLSRERLLPMLEAAARTVGQKSPLQIIKNALLHVDDEGSFTISSTNQYEALQQKIELLGSSPGIMSVPARELANFVAALPSGEIVLSQRGTQLNIKGMKGEFFMATLEVEQAPVIPSIPDDALWFGIGGDDLLSVLSETVYAAAAEGDSRTSLVTVALHLQGNTLTAWSTDSNRMGLRREQVSPVGEGEIRLLLPAESARTLVRLIPQGPAIKVGLTKNQAEFRIPTLTYWTRLVEGEPARYERIVDSPNPEPVRVVVPRLPLVDCLRRMRLARASATRTMLRFGADLHVSSVGEDGRAEETVDLLSPAEEMNLAVSANYLLATLEAWNDERVELFLSGPMDRIIIKPVGDRSSHASAVVMPMDLNAPD